MEVLLIIAVIGFFPMLWLIGTFNGLVRLRNHCKESWSDIDTELKRRHNLIPNLVETVKGYASHEKEVFSRVIEARNQAETPYQSVKQQSTEETALVQNVGRLFALAEDYPDLKADKNFLQLQQELVNTEDRIQAARRFFNANVRDMNNRVEMFPSSIVAGMGNFPLWDYFEIANLDIRIAPKIDL